MKRLKIINWTLSLLILIGCGSEQKINSPPLYKSTQSGLHILKNLRQSQDIKRLLLSGYSSRDVDRLSVCLSVLVDRLKKDQSVHSPPHSTPSHSQCMSLISLSFQSHRSGWLILNSSEDISLTSPLFHLSSSKKNEYLSRNKAAKLKHNPPPKFQRDSVGTRTLHLLMWRRGEASFDQLPQQWREAYISQSRSIRWSKNGPQIIEYPLTSSLPVLSQLTLPPKGSLWSLTLSLSPLPFISSGGWSAHIPLWLPVESLHHRLHVSSPIQWSLSSFGPAPFKRHKIYTEHRMSWRRDYAQAHSGEVVYLSTSSTWRALTQWAWSQLTRTAHDHQVMGQRIQYRFQQHTSIKKEATLEADINKTSTLLNTLHQWLTSTFRYTAPQLRRYTPTPFNELWVNRYGDCKDLSALARYLLHQHQVQAFFVLTSTDPQSTSMRKIPSIGWFNHVLLWIPTAEVLQRLKDQVERSVTPLQFNEPSQNQWRWFDLTAPSLNIPKALIGQWAWVLLGPSRGVWIRIMP